ncbi:nuclear pore complex protein NUP98A isoform X2 [Iris pallida]|uniref:Nuclear pore complex protein NUP98A isoform X2 n=1 Tax=Iris pallida TaxID=29817 RepID=A0AAX6G3Q7_IRIPA|nr:nuclear pore complex protein NUP98A isoform X2 [Iris pallida]
MSDPSNTFVGSFSAFSTSLSAPSSTGLSPASGAPTGPASASDTVFAESRYGQKPNSGVGPTSSQGNPFGSSLQTKPACEGSSLLVQNPSFGLISTPSRTNYSTEPAFGSAIQQTQPACSQQSQPGFGSKSFDSTTLSGAPNQLSLCLPVPLLLIPQVASFLVSQAPLLLVPKLHNHYVVPQIPWHLDLCQCYSVAPQQLLGCQGPNYLVPEFAPAFGVQNPSQFGHSSTPIYDAPSTSMFGSSSSLRFDASRNPTYPTYGNAILPNFGLSSTPFVSGCTPFNQATSTLSSMQLVTTPFEGQSSSFGTQTNTSAFGSPVFGQSCFGGQQGGSRVAAYTPTDDGTGLMVSISAMPIYKDKCHEELRWEDYQFRNRGTFNFPVSVQARPFTFFGTFGHPAENAFKLSSSFTPNPPTSGSTGFGSTSTSVFNTTGSASSSDRFGSNCYVTAPTLSALFTSAAPAQRSNSCSFAYIASSNGSGSMSSITNQGISGQFASTHSNMVMQPVPVTNPFGTLPVLPRMFTGEQGSAPSVQNENSSKTVIDLLRSLQVLEASSRATLRSFLSS